jgi:hypothetical protein
MAGDWIKMRGNLWDDPRVAKIVDLTDSSEAAVIGALYWLWATADQHTEDGVMQGLTTRGIDRKTGVKGFGDALVAIGWLADHADGVRIIDFEKHNGTSAKKRCQTAKRVANHEAANAAKPQQNQPLTNQLTQHHANTNAHSVSPALAREEKRREEREKTGGEREQAPPHQPGHPSAVASPPPIFANEFREFISTERPDLDGPATWLNFCDHYPAEKLTAANWRKWVRREMRGPVAGVDLAAPAAVSDPDSRRSVETLGVSLGLGLWAELKEPWSAYKARVRSTQLEPVQ